MQSDEFDWVDGLTALAVIGMIAASWACIPIVQLNAKKQPPQQSDGKPCTDCHGDYHKLTPLRSAPVR